MRRIWHNEPTLKPGALTPPPSWLFEDADQSDDVPASRRQPSSNANTMFYSRDELARVRSSDAQTDVLPDDLPPKGEEATAFLDMQDMLDFHDRPTPGDESTR